MVEEDRLALEQYIANPPKGYTVSSHSHSGIELQFKRSGMTALNLFLIVWVSIWTVACVFLVKGYLNNALMDDGSVMPFWFMAVFVLADIVVGSFLAYSLFCRKVFRLNLLALEMHVQLLCFNWLKVIPRAQIDGFEQVKDGGQGKDSFPSWGLTVLGKDGFTLVHRQAPEVSKWLGQVLSILTGAPYTAHAQFIDF